MMVDTPQAQKKIGFWTAIVGLAVFIVTYLLRLRDFAFGVAFGVGVITLNYQVVSRLLAKVFAMANSNLAKLVGFICYQLRFLLLVIVLFLVVSRFEMSFGVGVFVGLVINKVVMGVYVVRGNGVEWWNDRKVLELEQKEEQLQQFNPFEFDPVEEEIKKHLKL